MGKRAYLYEELGEGLVELMKMIKNAVDPLNLFNLGKAPESYLLFTCAGRGTAYSLAILAIPGEARQLGARSLREIFEEAGVPMCSSGLHE